VRKQIDAHPAAYSKFVNEDGSLGSEKLYVEPVDNWDGEVTRKDARPEGSNNMADAERKATAISAEALAHEKEDKEGVLPTVEDLEVEPPLTRDQCVSCLRY